MNKAKRLQKILYDKERSTFHVTTKTLQIV